MSENKIDILDRSKAAPVLESLGRGTLRGAFKLGISTLPESEEEAIHVRETWSSIFDHIFKHNPTPTLVVVAAIPVALKNSPGEWNMYKEPVIITDFGFMKRWSRGYSTSDPAKKSKYMVFYVTEATVNAASDEVCEFLGTISLEGSVSADEISYFVPLEQLIELHMSF